MLKNDLKRRGDLAKIHIAKKDLGLSDDIYRDILREATGQESSKDLGPRQIQKVLDRFRELGWKVRTPRKSKRASRPVTARDEWSRKIRALWLELDGLGVLRDSSEAALAKYVQRMTKSEENPAGIAALDWLREWTDANRVIESLKKWLQREEKIRRVIDFCRDFPGQVFPEWLPRGVALVVIEKGWECVKREGGWVCTGKKL